MIGFWCIFLVHVVVMAFATSAFELTTGILISVAALCIAVFVLVD
jgi:hypothetical protein